MLPSHNSRIAAAQSGVEEDVEHHSFACPAGPVLFECRDLIVRRYRKTSRLRRLESLVLDPLRGVGRNKTGVDGPDEQATHGADEVLGLRWRRCTAVSPIQYCPAVYPGERLPS